MKLSVVRQAKIEINRLLDAITRLERCQGKVDDDQGTVWYDGDKHTATVRRASMDLTRALVAVRRGF